MSFSGVRTENWSAMICDRAASVRVVGFAAVPMWSRTCAPSALSVDALVNASSAFAVPARAKRPAAAVAIKRKFMRNLLEWLFPGSDREEADTGLHMAAITSCLQHSGPIMLPLPLLPRPAEHNFH